MYYFYSHCRALIYFLPNSSRMPSFISNCAESPVEDGKMPPTPYYASLTVLRYNDYAVGYSQSSRHNMNNVFVEIFEFEVNPTIGFKISSPN